MARPKLLLSYIIIGILTILVSCSSSNKVISENGIVCKENLVFKKVFFENIQNVENLLYEIQGESLKNSLNFIGKYTKVSFESMANYAHTYLAGVFFEDKKVWLKWYEDNKCKNIQFKE